MFGFATFAQTPEPSNGSAVQFLRDVVPILRDKCATCHALNVQQAESRLDTRIEMLRGGKSGPAILENDPTKSLLIQRISGSEAGMQMPPTGPLTEKEIETLGTWVRAGAPWDAGASFTKERSVSPEARELFEAIRREQIPAMRKILGRNLKLVHALDENGSTPLVLLLTGPARRK